MTTDSAEDYFTSYLRFIDWPPSFAPEHFVIAPPNAEAVYWIDLWPDWPAPALMLVGPSGSGKSHLLDIWGKKTQAPIFSCQDMAPDILLNTVANISPDTLWPNKTWTIGLDDIDHCPSSQVLFDIYNLARQKGGHILMSAAQAPIFWAQKDPELMSRLMASPTARIRQPDDQMLRQLLHKHFSDHQLSPPPNVIDFLLVRMPRDFTGPKKIVQQLDALALEEKRKITIPFIKDVWSRIFDNAPI